MNTHPGNHVHKHVSIGIHALLAAGVPAARLHREVFGPDLLDNLL